jgi:hypothetical protein
VDVNRDGWIDLVTGDGKDSVFLQSAGEPGSFEYAYSVVEANYPQSREPWIQNRALADFDSDGSMDAVVTYRDSMGGLGARLIRGY